MRRRHRRAPPPRSGFAGFRFLPEVIMVAVRWYVRNTTGGNLTCKGNRPAPVGGGNLVEGNKEGQCAAL